LSRNPSLCVCWPVCPLLTPAPRGPLLRRCVITAIIALTAPCASLVPTSEFPSRLYRRPHGQETFPVLHPRPCDRAAAHTPESSLGAFARLFPRDTAFAVITSARRSQLPATCLYAGTCHDAAAIPSCYGPVACSPPWAVPSCDGEGFILGASIEVVTHPRRPIRYTAVRLLLRPVLPRLACDGCRLHVITCRTSPRSD